MRELKFRAWIPALEIILEEITLYPLGDIGIHSEELEKALKLKDQRMSIDWDSECIRLIDEDNDLFENLLDVMTGDDWIQISSNECIIMQWTGLIVDKIDLFEGDVLINTTGLVGEIIYFNSKAAFFWKYINKTKKILLSNIDEGFLKNKKLLGNIYQNSELS